MPEYDFTLKFKLSEDLESEIYINQLYESGCDDALIGIGKPGYIALNFTREATSAILGISSAIKNIKAVIPNARLLNASPDLVGVTDIANLLGCSRQNIQKLISNDNRNFPTPIYEGAQSIWHLASVLTWLVEHKAYSINEHLIEISQATMMFNLAQQCQMLDPNIKNNFPALI
ncbi:MAG: DNA-binding protein [Xenococcaceae cyanobacterium MO_188.B19]|nr:DNA-binding protein [Xenococcaceae cyanobacterium MO_188.B19]